MVLRPDQALLSGADVQFPVYIDPSYAKATKRWAWANDDNETNNSEVRIGQSPSSGAVYRSYFTFDVTGLRGKRIFAARFNSTIIHSWSCGSTPFSLYQVASAGTGRINWGLALGTKMGEASGHAHKPSTGAGCSDDPQPDVHTEIGGSMTAAVAGGASSNATELSFALTALSGGGGEGTAERWKKFKLADTKLTADFNSVPSVPTSASTDGRGCATGTARPVLSTATPTLRAVVGDADVETDLQAVFAWQRYDTTVSPAAWVALGSGQMNGLRPAATGSVQIKSGLTQGQVYRWQVKTVDPWTYNGSSGSDASTPTGWCEFGVDLVGPGVGPGVSSSVYGSDINRVYGSVGQTAPFSFTASGVTDVTAYRYGWADPPTTQVAVAAGAAASLHLTPPPPAPADPTSGGLERLYVASLDAAGHISPLTEYVFNVGSGTTETGLWKLDGTGYTNGVAGGPAFAPAGAPVTGVTGRMQPGPGKAAATAVDFDGVDDTASTAEPVLNTETSFTVSVWARSDADTADYRSVVSAPGTHASAFFLGRADTGKWRLTLPRTDSATATAVNTFSTSSIATGVWTNLTAVYDVGAQMVYLYVNGVLEGTGAQPYSFRGARLQIARDIWADNAAYHKPWNGAVADLRVWNRVLTAGEIAPMATDLAGRWNLDGDGYDSTPYQHDAALTETALWDVDHDSTPNSALLGDGIGVAATTTGPVVRTEQSYTAAAWVRLDSTVTFAQVLGQAGSVGGAIYLRFDVQTGMWEFFTSTAETGTLVWRSARSTAPAVVGKWTHLVGVYDASAGMLKLYVNGVLNGTITVKMWAANGLFDIGRKRFGTQSYFNGAIDEVRMYQGAMPATQVAALYAG
jgi:hypothetical protein